MIKKWLKKRAEKRRIKYENASCGDRIKPHDWDYTYETRHVGTNKFYKGEELTAKKFFHIRTCQRCGRVQVWDDWWGWEYSI